VLAISLAVFLEADARFIVTLRVIQFRGLTRENAGFAAIYAYSRFDTILCGEWMSESNSQGELFPGSAFDVLRDCTWRSLIIVVLGQGSAVDQDFDLETGIVVADGHRGGENKCATKRLRVSYVARVSTRPVRDEVVDVANNVGDNWRKTRRAAQANR
jgi:hypothetical protein